MSQANLSETLFKPRFKHPETSTLVRRFSAGKPQAMQSALSGNHVDPLVPSDQPFDVDLARRNSAGRSSMCKRAL